MEEAKTEKRFAEDAVFFAWIVTGPLQEYEKEQFNYIYLKNRSDKAHASTI